MGPVPPRRLVPTRLTRAGPTPLAAQGLLDRAPAAWPAHPLIGERIRIAFNGVEYALRAVTFG